MTDNHLWEQAHQGNSEAITDWLNHQFSELKVIVKTHLEHDLLEVEVEAVPAPNRYEFLELIQGELIALEPEGINRAKVIARESGKAGIVWSQEFALSVGTYSSIMNPSTDSPEKNVLIGNLSTQKNLNRSPENRLNSTFIVVISVLILWVISLGVFLQKNWQKSGSQNTEILTEPLPETSPEASDLSPTSAEIIPPPSPTISPKNNPPLTPVDRSFQEAVSKAESASNMVKLAKSQEQWKIVIKQWEEAIELMEKVPPTSVHYEVAQKKVSEYKKYLRYAKQTARGSR